MKALQVYGLQYRYSGSDYPVLSGVTFKVHKGEALGVMGLSGSGKTTLCRCLSGLIPHYLGGEMTGQVLVCGQDTRETPLSRLSSLVGMVLQDPDTQLFSPTVEDELAFGPENFCLARDEIKSRIDWVAKMLGLEQWLLEHPHHLSGGQKQLVALGSVLTLDPEIIVLDEVLTHLDDEGAGRIIAVIAELRRRGKTLVIVDHSGRALNSTDKIFVLEAGRIIHRGPREKILADRPFLQEHKLSLSGG